MHITKKIDRAFQWAGEKMGAEAKTTMSEDFKMLEMEMNLRYDGMERLQRSMNSYVKWLGRRGEPSEDKEKGFPVDYLGRTMLGHGEDFEPGSDFGNCLVNMGRANERIAGIQERFATDATAAWLESLERSLAMMREYQSARKKLENRRLAYDASINRMQKAKRDDFRVEEEFRTNKAKYEESSEDVMRRMQDIKDAEVDSMRDLSRFLDLELDYHERCAEELRRVRQSWPCAVDAGSCSNSGGLHPDRRPTGRSRSNTARSFSERLSRTASNNNITEVEEPQPEPQPVRLPIRSSSRPGMGASLLPPDMPARPTISTAQTFHQGTRIESSPGRSPSVSGPSNGGQLNMGSLRGSLRPTGGGRGWPSTQDVFADRDEDSVSGGSVSPGWGERSASPATSFDSLARSSAGNAAAGPAVGGQRKAPPPPPPSRAKKPPPPPVPIKREMTY